MKKKTDCTIESQSNLQNQKMKLAYPNLQKKMPTCLAVMTGVHKVIFNKWYIDELYDFLFINPKTHRRYTNINKTWKRLKTEAGLPHLRLHDLRHQFASQLVNAGHSLYEVQQILGHSDPTVTTRYAHLSSRTLQGAAESAALNLGDGQARIAQRL